MMPDRTKQLSQRKRQITVRGEPLPNITETARVLFGLCESLMKTMDETGTYGIGLQAAVDDRMLVEFSASRNRCDVEWDETDEA